MPIRSADASPSKPLASPVDGFVLVGGSSTRFGADKAAAIVGGISLAERAAGLLRQAGTSIHLVGPVEQDYGIPDCVWITEETPGRGPAEGLRVCLARARAWALVLAVDMPWLPIDLLDVLMKERERGDLEAVCFRDAGGRRHPFPGLYRRSLLDAPAAVASRSMHEILDCARLRVLGPESIPASVDFYRSLANANRPEDLRS